jgi:hypothetical protein
MKCQRLIVLSIHVEQTGSDSVPGMRGEKLIKELDDSRVGLAKKYEGRKSSTMSQGSRY